jgi:DNA topoisomerase-3
LPIVPDVFQLQADPHGAQQLAVLNTQMNRSDVDEIVNGCDAGREGELIFAYIQEWTRTPKPVRRLWVSSMTHAAIQAGFGQLQASDAKANLTEAARSRSEAD